YTLKSNAISQFRRAIGDDRPYKTVLFPSKPYIHQIGKPQFTAIGPGARQAASLPRQNISSSAGTSAGHKI
ncbi:MAG: hypothetical protein FWC04_07910, partial [Chitinispirillia bacterium]|nr:hypothetical protein [Chitinispirillia bacterium]